MQYLIGHASDLITHEGRQGYHVGPKKIILFQFCLIKVFLNLGGFTDSYYISSSIWQARFCVFWVTASSKYKHQSIIRKDKVITYAIKRL